MAWAVTTEGGRLFQREIVFFYQGGGGVTTYWT